MKRAILLAAIVLFASSAWAQTDYDLVITNGRIVDGGGNPWYVADVGIRDGHIAAIGRLCGSSGATGVPACGAKRVFDAKGLIVAPGFIDVHTHVESNIERVPTADNYLFDGVTSIITGNCGGSETDLAKWFAELREKRISINLGTLIGHNSVRRAVMGTENRDPTPDEQARMGALVEQAMRDGAVGFSTGLIYIPGTYSKTPEVVALARAGAKYNGVYASHMRNEETRIYAAIDEAIAVGRDAGMPVEISHFKLSSKRMWNKSDRIIGMVEKARAEGIDVNVDQYPYTASSTNLGVLLPSWSLAGGPDEFRKRIADPATKKKIVQEAKNDVRTDAGFKRLDYAVVASCSWDRSLEGKSIAQINKEKGRKGKLKAELETVIEMVEKGGAQMVYHKINERDSECILRFPYSMVASDGGVREFGVGVPHPRSYGTNARVLARYVRERNTLRLEEAVRKMTSFPAQRFRLVDRGLIRPGMWADIVVFDEKTVADKATFEKPHAYSEGFAYVLVNGEVVIEGGKHTGARPGQILLGPGAQPPTVATSK